jgi:hypothetical protein
VRGIGGHAEADDFGVDAGAAGPRGFERLEHQHGSAFAEDHAAAVFGKRAAGVGRNHAHGFPGFEDAATEGRFTAAGDGQRSRAGADHPIGLADGVGGRGTGGGNGEAGAGDAELHGNVGSAGVGHGLGDGQRVHAVAAVLVNFLKADVLGGLAADAGAGDDRGIFAQLGGPLGGGIGDGFARGDDGELGEAVHEIGAAILEVRTVGVVGDLGAVLKTDP